jgi:hypothetical protein
MCAIAGWQMAANVTPLTGGAVPAGSRAGGCVATPGTQATTSVNVARANGGTRGGNGRIAAKRGRCRSARQRRSHC